MAPIKILEPARAGQQWDLRTKAVTISKLPDRCYAFLEAGDYKSTDRREAILAHFGVPKFVANRTCFESNGFFGHKPTYKENEKSVASCTTWFRCLCKMVEKLEESPHEDGPEYAIGENYTWYEMTFFSRWEFPDKCQVLCVNVPFDFPEELQRTLGRQAPLDFKDPFAMHAGLWDQMIVYSDISVWRVRDPVRRLEKSRLRPGEVFLPTHEFSRHAIHVSEVLEVAVDTITEMQRCRTEIHERLPELSDSYKFQVGEYSRFQISLLKSLKLRSDSNRARLTTEITFAFNSLSRQDSHLIKSISLLTMIFLPATFVSAIFSTSFFDLGDNGWQVSSKIWILWATIVPATIIVIFVWQVWLAKDERILRFLQRSPKKLVTLGVRSLTGTGAALNKPKVEEP